MTLRVSLLTLCTSTVSVLEGVAILQYRIKTMFHMLISVATLLYLMIIQPLGPQRFKVSCVSSRYPENR